MKREVSRMKMRPLLPEKEKLSSDFSIHNTKTASLLHKPGKAPGPEGIHNEFQTYPVQTTKMGNKFF